MNTVTIDLDNLNEPDRSAAKLLAEISAKPKVWEPKIVKPYFYINDTGNICEKVWVSDYADCIRYELGNCYPTREKAEFAVEKLKVTTELERFAEENNEGEIEWENKWKSKWFLYWDYYFNNLSISHTTSFRTKGVYFTSKEIAERAIAEIEVERLKKYYFEVV